MYIILKIKCVTQITFTRYFNTIKYKILYGAFSCTTSPIYHHKKTSTHWSRGFLNHLYQQYAHYFVAVQIQ